jgi:hypothetical protein
MATKVNLMKFLQEMRGFGEFGKRHPAPRRSPLYLLQLRSHVAETSGGKRRLIIATDPKDFWTLPHPVKINFIKTAAPEEVPSMV